MLASFCLMDRLGSESGSGLSLQVPPLTLRVDSGSIDDEYQGYEIWETGAGLLLASEAVDLAFAQSSIVARLEDPPFSPDTSYDQLLEAIVSIRLAEGQDLFDGECVRLETDPGQDMLARIRRGEPTELLFRRAGFFSSLCTNEFCGGRLVDQASGQVVGEGPSLLDQTSGLIRNLEGSPLSNLAGISTLMICSDDRVVLQKQTEANHVSGGLTNPSGSGSLEPQDFGTGGASLSSVIQRGMERELREECSLPDGASIKTELLGFGRWLERGAKPEFFGISVSDMSSTEVVNAPINSGEKSYVGDLWSVPLEDILYPALDLSSKWAVPLHGCAKALRTRFCR